MTAAFYKDIRHNWVQVTTVCTGGVMILGILIPAVITWSGDRKDLAAHDQSLRSMEPRVQSLEQSRAANAEIIKNMDKRLESIDRKIDTLIKAGP